MPQKNGFNICDRVTSHFHRSGSAQKDDRALLTGKISAIVFPI
ncbi:MAG: hypothetical protein ACRCT1_21920 [Microcoleaceae cyanobacterium]